MNAEDFWQNVDQSGGPKACWPWMRARDKQGYGKVYWREDGRAQMMTAHSVAFFLANGWRPRKSDGKLTRHRCDNRPCCNASPAESGDF